MTVEKYREIIKAFYGDESSHRHFLIISDETELSDIDLAYDFFAYDQFGNVYDTKIDPVNFTSMAEVYVAVGVFPSLSQARKNGKDTPIPAGYSEHKLGKKKIRVYIYNARNDG